MDAPVPLGATPQWFRALADLPSMPMPLHGQRHPAAQFDAVRFLQQHFHALRAMKFVEAAREDLGEGRQKRTMKLHGAFRLCLRRSDALGNGTTVVSFPDKDGAMRLYDAGLSGDATTRMRVDAVYSFWFRSEPAQDDPTSVVTALERWEPVAGEPLEPRVLVDAYAHAPVEAESSTVPVEQLIDFG
tara:strand:- start:377 stop:937 length:561 start_codon:yes stop_codon:yes gene_type:complete